MNNKTWRCKALVVAMGLAALNGGLALADEKQQSSKSAVNTDRNAETPADSSPSRMVKTPGAPDMTEADFQRGTEIYLQRCVACHGAQREGATGKPLTPDITQARGEAALNAFITYGTAGVHNWGTSGVLTKQEISIMSRFIMHKPPAAPSQDTGNTTP
ncbi:c-type cytochrome [Achromobacter xylosoxidans]|uniref:c-type cytochrome n=1 Tax=Alcaligenes xylosoxydans xylosoxydans TaxID=85698 RepID=UPI001EEEB7B8|nr:cytochrome c [Achromobacter xylosoxidans]